MGGREEVLPQDNTATGLGGASGLRELKTGERLLWFRVEPIFSRTVRGPAVLSPIIWQEGHCSPPLYSGKSSQGVGPGPESWESDSLGQVRHPRARAP